MQTTKIGIVGCGNISGIYCKAGETFDILEIAACADLVPQRAEARAREFGIPRSCTVDELLADPEIAIVVNLTIPLAHAEVAMKAVEAGKSVYNEKPLTATREHGRALLAAAEAKGVRVGGAPDTFLGAGLQTCRMLMDDGAIGRPVAATAFMTCHGHETWHPDPEFYYKPGGGPMFDMGPYYLTALVSMLGPIRRVTGSAQASFPQRTVTSQPKHGQVIDVETPTHIAGVVDFKCGAVGTIITSFDVYGGNLPRIEIYGSEGTLTVPDPNAFGGPVKIQRGGGDFEEVPLTHGYAENSRGLGVADMASALRSGRPHRASGSLAYHVLDVMHAFLDASEQGRHIEPESTCEKPAALPVGLKHGTIDA
jgi:predicted dehydrogenase